MYEDRQDEFCFQPYCADSLSGVAIGDEPTFQSPASEHGRDEWPRRERAETRRF